MATKKKTTTKTETTVETEAKVAQPSDARDAGLSPKLKAIKQATIEAEQRLAGRSLKQGPVRSTRKELEG